MDPSYSNDSELDHSVYLHSMHRMLSSSTNSPYPNSNPYTAESFSSHDGWHPLNEALPFTSNMPFQPWENEHYHGNGVAWDHAQDSHILSQGTAAYEIQTNHTTPSKPTFPCLHAGCKNKGFSRAADLDRHQKTVHDDKQTKCFCDYKKCPRHEAGFHRKDHYRDHLQDFHKEDLFKRSKKYGAEWWAARNPKALHGGWWRCSKCYVRVNIEEDDFVCPGCENPCEPERREVREKREDASIVPTSSVVKTQVDHEVSCGSSWMDDLE